MEGLCRRLTGDKESILAPVCTGRPGNDKGPDWPAHQSDHAGTRTPPRPRTTTLYAAEKREKRTQEGNTNDVDLKKPFQYFGMFWSTNYLLQLIFVCFTTSQDGTGFHFTCRELEYLNNPSKRGGKCVIAA